MIPCNTLTIFVTCALQLCTLSAWIVAFPIQSAAATLLYESKWPICSMYLKDS